MATSWRVDVEELGRRRRGGELLGEGYDCSGEDVENHK